MSEPIRQSEDGVLVDVLVVPNASRAMIVGIHGDRVKVKIAAPPEKGRANAAVLDLLTDATGARTASVVAGRTTRFKTVVLGGASIDAVRDALSGR
jgi:uncharacterized protein (TIGR00251 family)